MSLLLDLSLHAQTALGPSRQSQDWGCTERVPMSVSSTRLIARKELELGTDVRYINIELAKFFPSWTNSKIGMQRKQQRYQDILAKVKADILEPNVPRQGHTGS